MSFELSQLLYNQKDICNTYKNCGIEKAIELIKQKQQYLILISDEDFSSNVLIFLTSLNNSLYNYILFNSDIESEDFCFKNYTPDLNIKINHKSAIDEAYKILASYEKFIHPANQQNKHIESACKYICEHLNEDLSLEKVASNIYISKCYLCQLFSDYSQMKFSEYVRIQRIELAKFLLKCENYPIDIISQKCGFSYCSYFSSTFKKIVGISPEKYRKIHSKKNPINTVSEMQLVC